MSTLQKVVVDRNWSLVYDASVSGSFTGAVASLHQEQTIYRVATSLPSANDAGMNTSDWLKVSLSQTKGEKLYARSTDDKAEILLDASMGADANDAELSRKIASTVDILGQMNTAEYTPIVAQKPLPGLSFLRDKKVGGDSQFSVVGGEIKIDGGLGLRSLYTKDYGLYLPGLLGVGGLRVRSATPTTGTFRQGYGSDQGDRVGLESVNGAWTTFVESEGTRWYAKPRAEWMDKLDGTGPSGVNADLNGCTFRVILGWYGGISILFSVIVADREKGDRLVVFDASGPRPNGVTLSQPDLPIFAEADGCVIYVGGRQYGVFGRYRPQERITSNRKVIKAVSETLAPLASMRHKDALRWLAVPISFSGETVTCNRDAEYVIVIGGTLTVAGGAVPEVDWVAPDGIDSEETALEQNTTADSITGGYRAPGDSIVAAAGRSSGRSMSDAIGINIPAGEVVTVALATDPGAGAGTASVIMRMRENW